MRKLTLLILIMLNMACQKEDIIQEPDQVCTVGYVISNASCASRYEHGSVISATCGSTGFDWITFDEISRGRTFRYYNSGRAARVDRGAQSNRPRYITVTSRGHVYEIVRKETRCK